MTQQLIHIANLGLNILNVRFQYKADINLAINLLRENNMWGHLWGQLVIT